MRHRDDIPGARRSLLLSLLLLASGLLAGSLHAELLDVVTTLPDYADLARRIGADRVRVHAIVRGDQDAHFIRPKPSFVQRVARADVLIATGLDLELWLPTVVDRSGNTRVRSGRPGYVSAARGMTMLQVPETLSRVEGGLHIYGNPHVTCSPINMKVAARNIAGGLIKNDPAGRSLYEANLKRLHRELDERLFGSELVRMLGGDVLGRLAEQQKLISFLEENRHQGRPLIESLGGWMGALLPYRGTPVVTYHLNWIYFFQLFGLVEAGTVEPKPGIPPTVRHRAELLRTMQRQDVELVWAANYFDRRLAESVARRAGAEAVIVPLYVGGEPGVDSYFELVDLWVERLGSALGERKGR